MRFLSIVLLTTLLSACTVNQDSPTSAEVAGEPAVALDPLRDRTLYAGLDEQAVESLARVAADHWKRELAGFTLRRVEHFAAGGVSHWMSIWSHERTGLEFALLPGGTYWMGAPENEPGRREDEVRTEVNLGPFLVARTECTWEAWSAGSSATDRVNAPSEQPQRLPVSGYPPADIEAWCAELLLTLPTEAQWEYLCRAGTTTAWTMGADAPELARYGNIGSRECPESWVQMEGVTEPWYDGFGDESAPVGSFASNAFGLFDVHGNVSEWCRDHYFSYEVHAEAGTGERAGRSGERIARGGNFGGDASAARSSRRLTAGAGASSGNHGFGFRPSVDLPL